jgi:hypothetical protein
MSDNMAECVGGGPLDGERRNVWSGKGWMRGISKGVWEPMEYVLSDDKKRLVWTDCVTDPTPEAPCC